ncbi:MAG: hypothetical protein HYY14_05935, partial [Candidatus Omnitrophica bacterium]|nr:hypothetical protein [Candidatus Omnitrophota bacterium]
SWTIPNTPNDDTVVRITKEGDSVATDVSDGNFFLFAGIRLDAPSGLDLPVQTNHTV